MSMTDSLKTLLANAGINDDAVLAKLAEKGLTAEDDVDSLQEKHLIDAGMPEIKASKAFKRLKPTIQTEAPKDNNAGNSGTNLGGGLVLNLSDMKPIAEIHDTDELIDIMLGARPKTDKDKAQKKLEQRNLRVAYNFEAGKISWDMTRDFRTWVTEGGSEDREEFNDHDILPITEALNINRSVNMFTGKLLSPDGVDEFNVTVPVKNEGAMQFAAWLILRHKDEVIPTAPYKVKDLVEFYKGVVGAVAGEKDGVYNKLYRRYRRELAMEPAIAGICAAMLKFRHKKNGTLLAELLNGMPNYLNDGGRPNRSSSRAYDRSDLPRSSGGYDDRSRS